MAKFKLPGRNEGTRSPHKTVLIVCEGARTEPDYFESFRLSKVVKTVGTGTNTLSNDTPQLKAASLSEPLQYHIKLLAKLILQVFNTGITTRKVLQCLQLVLKAQQRRQVITLDISR
jgi:hypothetical protein